MPRGRRGRAEGFPDPGAGLPRCLGGKGTPPDGYPKEAPRIWDALNAFRRGKYRLTYEATKPVALHGYLGSLVRGAFGARLRRLSCPSATASCDGCESRESCPYGYVFETPVPRGAERLRTHQDIPRPFVIQVPPPGVLRLSAGDELALHLVLFGRALDYLPQVAQAFGQIERLAQDPTDGPGGDVRLEEFAADGNGQGAHKGWDSPAPLPTDPANAIRVDFLTMTRLKHDGGYVRRPEFHVLVRNLLRRAANLLYFHGGGDLGVDFRALIEKARCVSLSNDSTRWVDWSRYSRRQDMTMDLTGFLGQVRYAGDVAPFLPLLRFGEYCHVGKNATLGLGRMKVSEDPR